MSINEDSFKINLTLMNNFEFWLYEFENDKPYETAKVALPYEEFKKQYFEPLKRACHSGYIINADLKTLAELAAHICAAVGHMQYPPCEVALILREECKKRAIKL